jgi:hypothetical protein
MKNTTTIKPSQILAAVSNSSGFCTIQTLTSPDMNKRGNPFLGRVTVRTERCGQFGVSYQNAVIAQRAREGHPSPDNFQSEGLWKGKGRAISRNIVEHTETGKQYIVLYPSRMGAEVVTRSTAYFVDDRPATAQEVAAIKSFLKGANSVPKQEVANTVAWRTIALENIEAINTEGQSFQIQP